MCHTSDIYLDEDIFIMFCRSKTISVSKLSNFYCSHLWYDFTKVQTNKLRITYNNAMRRLVNLHFRCSANIHSMDEMRRTCIYSFIQRLKCSSNAIITCFMPSTYIQKCGNTSLLRCQITGERAIWYLYTKTMVMYWNATTTEV